ncbi:MAG: hypothetical protein MUO76_09120, partial [Anaerolineaceae bacterium]|nr:hypothetical protein [Anaerolineaceae bacterium]
ILDEDLLTVARLVLDANKPRGYLPVSNEISLTQLFSPVVDEHENISIRILAERNIQQEIKNELIAQELTGLNLQEAITFFESNYELEKKPEINIIPEFWKRLPFLAFRIAIDPS